MFELLKIGNKNSSPEDLELIIYYCTVKPV